MNEGPFRQQQEKLPIKLTIATPSDWQACRELRLQAITGKDASMFSITQHPERVEEEKRRSELEWKKDLSREDYFTVLLWRGDDAIGMGRARKRVGEKDWYMGAGYVKEDFRNQGMGRKIFATRLTEIRRRGGTKVMLGVDARNGSSIRVAELFGFKKVEEDADRDGFYMALPDVNNPEVIKKINEVLNAG